VSERDKGRSYKDDAKRAYAHYKKYGIFGSVGNFWRWLLKKPERLTALSTFAIFLATAVAIGVGVAQWRALRSTDITLQDNLVASTRAWIVPTGVKIDGELSAPLLIRIMFENTGKEVALNMVHFRGTYTFPVKLDAAGTPYVPVEGTSWPLNQSCDQDISQYQYGRPIYPGQNSSDFQYVFTAKDDPGIPILKSKTLSFVIYGCFIYKSFDKWRHSPYCFYFQAYRDPRPIDDSTFEVCPLRIGRAD
jgi:hypothetical protein